MMTRVGIQMEMPLCICFFYISYAIYMSLRQFSFCLLWWYDAIWNIICHTLPKKTSKHCEKLFNVTLNMCLPKSEGVEILDLKLFLHWKYTSLQNSISKKYSGKNVRDIVQGSSWKQYGLDKIRIIRFAIAHTHTYIICNSCHLSLQFSPMALATYYSKLQYLCVLYFHWDAYLMKVDKMGGFCMSAGVSLQMPQLLILMHTRYKHT